MKLLLDNAIISSTMERGRTRDPEAELHNVLEELAAKHIGGFLDLQLLPYNPMQYSDQQLTHSHNAINPEANLETIRAYATIAAGEAPHPGRFNHLVEQFKTKQEVLDNIATILGQGKNVALITNHSQIHDIAIVQAALVTALKNPEIIADNAIVISKLITRFQAFGLPGTAVLGNLAHVFFSIPRTKSILHSGIDNSVATVANNDMQRKLGMFMNEPRGKLVAIAPSGSTDERELDGRSAQKLTLQRISSGTVDLLTRFDAILPVAVWLEADEHRHSIEIGSLHTVYSEADAHAVMEWLARETSHLAGITTVYEEERLGGIERFRQFVAERVIRND